MQYYANIHNGIVINIIVCDSEYAATLDSSWVEFKENTAGNVQYDSMGIPTTLPALRYNTARIGGKYDAENDAFYAGTHPNGWVLNNTTFLYEPPIPMPTDGKRYIWNSDILDWIEDSIVMPTDIIPPPQQNIVIDEPTE